MGKGFITWENRSPQSWCSLANAALRCGSHSAHGCPTCWPRGSSCSAYLLCVRGVEGTALSALAPIPLSSGPPPALCTPCGRADPHREFPIVLVSCSGVRFPPLRSPGVLAGRPGEPASGGMSRFAPPPGFSGCQYGRGLLPGRTLLSRSGGLVLSLPARCRVLSHAPQPCPTASACPA